MKKVLFVLTTAAAFAVLTLTAAAPGYAVQHGNGGHASASTKAMMAGAKTPAAVLAMADKHLALLTSTIKSKKLASVHEHAFAVRDAVKMLPGVSQSLPAATRTRLATGVKTVSSLAAELDEAGDSGNQAETEALHKRLVTTMKAIKGLYSAGGAAATRKTPRD